MKNLIDRLGARALKASGASVYPAADFERLTGFRLPIELSSLLEKIGRPVVFDQGAKFIPSSPSGREDQDGRRSVNVLHGFTSGMSGLIERHKATEDDLPPNVIPIGEAPGGDQICLDLGSQKILLWKHDVEPEEFISEISNNIAGFLQSLEPDGISDAKSELKIKRSFFDF